MKKFYTLLLILCSSQFVFAQTWTKVDCGTEFSLALKSDGTIWSWGYNGSGQLGVGSSISQSEIPLQVGTDNDWVDIAAGAVHVLALKSDGTLWAWGDNSANQLGDGTINQSDLPTQIGSDTDWLVVEAGMVHSFGIKTNNTLWGWGYNNFGQVGDGSTVDVMSPTQIGTDMDWTHIAAGGIHTLALKSSGTLWTWGANVNGQLGLGNTNSVSNPAQCGTHSDWFAISAGLEFSVGLRQGGSLWTWGFNGNDQLGDDGLAQTTPTPTHIEPNIQWSKISAGSAFAFGITSGGSLYSWGFNLYGSCGQGHNNNVSSVTQVGTGTDWEEISAAEGLATQTGGYGFHAIAMKTGKFVLCATGYNFTGQLGDGSTADKSVFDCNTASLAPTSVINMDKDVQDLELYPNPTTGLIHIKASKMLDDVQIDILNVSGQIMSTKRMEQLHETSIDLTSFPSGLYYLRVTNARHSFSKTITLE